MKTGGSLWITVGLAGLVSCGGRLPVGSDPGAGGAGGATTASATSGTSATTDASATSGTGGASSAGTTSAGGFGGSAGATVAVLAEGRSWTIGSLQLLA